MTMPVDDFHERHDLPTPRFTVENTGYKYPTNMGDLTDSGSGGWTNWSSLGPDDLDLNTQVVLGGDGVRENVAYISNSLLVKAFNGAKVPTGDVIDSITISFYALMDSDGTRDYSMRVSKVGIGNSYPTVYPTADIASSIFPIFSNGIYENGDWRTISQIPAADFGIGNITAEMVNDPEFYVMFQITKTAGSSTNTSRARFYTVGINIYHHTPDPLPAGAGTDAANLIKFSTF